MQRTIETIIGFIVIVVALIFAIFIYSFNFSNTQESRYLLYTECSNAEGIIQGSDVYIAGIKIGKVTKLKLNPNNFYASIEIEINNDVKLPKDSYGAVVSNGLLGDKFISITPGVSPEFLSANSSITVFPGISLEGLLGKLMYSFTNSNSKSKD